MLRGWNGFRITWACVACLSTWAATAQAGLRVSFRADLLSWRATDIVVVDARGAVLETWKGSLREGEVIPVGEMDVPLRPVTENVFPCRRPDRSGWPCPPIVEMSDRRRVMFLVKELQAGRTRWRPAGSSRDMETSVAWIENDRAYAFRQVLNPGPRVLTCLGKSEAELRQAVAAVVDEQAALRATEAMDDRVERARALAAFVDSDRRASRREALEMLSGCDGEALPVLREMASDPGRFSMSHDLLRVMGDADRSAAMPDFAAVVEAELRYWGENPPPLGLRARGAREHLHRLEEALRQLACGEMTADQVDVVLSLRESFRGHVDRAHWRSTVGAHGRPRRWVGIVDLAEAALRASGVEPTGSRGARVLMLARPPIESRR